ncbi:MAG: hypothetical protein KKH25_00590, partial [Candidatus Omnitrophica bacterium]|nr:hypothetical protein [Candidatus Omnitrophota bacterium]
MKELARYKNIILAIGVVLVSLFLIRSLHSHYSSKLANLAREDKEIEEAQIVMHQWESLNSQSNTLKSNLFKEDSLLVKKFIEEKAKFFNIELVSLRLSRFDRDAYWEALAQFQATCTY